MQRNYWQEYWDNYYKFMAMYLGEVQNTYPNADMKKEYIEISRLFEPPVSPGGNNNLNSNMMNNNMNNNSMTNGYDIIGNENMMDDYEMLNNEDMINNYDMMNGNSMNNGLGVNNNQSTQSNMGEGTYTDNGMYNGQTMNNNEMYNYTFKTLSGGQFNMNNCRKMSVVRIEMRDDFTPSRFFMLVESSDRMRMQGFRMEIDSNEIRFVPATVEYRNINMIECAI